jgi:cyclophilin family peptidyl-prolyl cis-trans isomerase
MKAKIETLRDMVEIDLFEAETPMKEGDFEASRYSDFYLVSHRIIEGFVIQTGDPSTTNDTRNQSRWGIGGSGKAVPLEVDLSLRNETRSLDMAGCRGASSDGSQFYINLGNNNTLE